MGIIVYVSNTQEAGESSKRKVAISSVKQTELEVQKKEEERKKLETSIRNELELKQLKKEKEEIERQKQQQQAEIERLRREKEEAARYAQEQEQKRLEEERKRQVAAQNLRNTGLIESYVTRIGHQDKFSSRGVRLEKAEEIIRQDRANYYKFYKRDAEDRPDQFFSGRKNRALLERMVRRGGLSQRVKRAIIYNSPLIRVNVYTNYVLVDIL